MSMTYEQQLAYLQKLQQSVTSLSSYLDAKAKSLSIREQQLRQGQMPNNSAQQLDYNLTKSLSPLLTPGNIGDINSVIWPYFFPTDIPDSPLAQDESFPTGFSVTQEAAFIFMSFNKVVYLVEGEDEEESWTYLDPDQGQPSAPGLTFTLRDGSSTRQLFNTPMNIDAYGHPRFVTKFPRPVMLLPNQVMQVTFTNSHPTNRYVPIITAFGYRIRIEEAQKLLSLVYA